jgi:hypothetical protein
MTQRTIFTGFTPTVVVRAGGAVQIEGWDKDQVLAETDSAWGLKVEKRNEAQIAHIRAKVGDYTLVDWRVNSPSLKKETVDDATEVEIGGSGKVFVPFNSVLKVYSGKGADVNGVQGTVAVYAGGNALLRNVGTLLHVSAGGAIDLECERVDGKDIKFSAGRDLRCYIRDLANATLSVHDLGGYWEGQMGDGAEKIKLRAGGDVIVVTEQMVTARPPDYVLGRIEKP